MTKRWEIVLGWSLAALVLALCSCVFGGGRIIEWLMSSPRPITVSNWPGGLVDRPGTYTMSGGETFRVLVKNGIVEYDLRSSTGQTLLSVNEYRASDYHRWFFYFDDQRRLWFYSGDIGTFIWLPQSDGTYAFEGLLKESQYSKQLPKEFYSKLDTSEQRDFSPAP
jgi:hypothetical protein